MKKTQSNKVFYTFLAILWILCTIAFWNQYELNTQIAELRTGLEFNTNGGKELEENLHDLRNRVKDTEYKTNFEAIIEAKNKAAIEYPNAVLKFIRMTEDNGVLFQATVYDWGHEEGFTVKVKETENSFIITRQ